MRGILNVVDLISIVPFYLELVLSVCGFDVDSLSDIKGMIFQEKAVGNIIFRSLFGCSNNACSTSCPYFEVITLLYWHENFCFNIEKFGSTVGNDGFVTFTQNKFETFFIGIVLFTGVVFFSTLLYFVEKDDPETPFTSVS